MCGMSSASVDATPAQALIAGTNSMEATQSARMEARLRRARAGAAANVLTSPTGLPGLNGTTTQLGGVA